MGELLIEGGRVIDPASGFDETADVRIVDGIITQIGRVSASEASVIHAEGCIVAPGLIDVHVHFREPDPQHEETIASGSAAAVTGGYTTVCCMPNTCPPLDRPKLIQEVQRQGRRAAGARIFACGCATEGRQGVTPAPIADLAKAGAVAFTDDGDCVADDDVMAEVLELVRATGRCFMQHCQDPAMTRGAAMNAGPIAQSLGLTGWPVEAEQRIIDRDLQLSREIGGRYHAQHLSSGGSVDLIRQARRDGLEVTAEVTPHHLLLTEDACDGNTNAKVNPPLRRADDIEQLKTGVADGTITILGSDHAPHPVHRKQVDFKDAAFGIVGLDCSLALYLKALVEGGVIDMPTMLAMMTIHPATLLGIDRMGLGRLAVGGPGDVTVIDPVLAWTIRPDDFTSAGRNCPYDGWSVKGAAIATIVAGEVRLSRADRSTRKGG